MNNKTKPLCKYFDKVTVDLNNPEGYISVHSCKGVTELKIHVTDDNVIFHEVYEHVLIQKRVYPLQLYREMYTDYHVLMDLIGAYPFDSNSYTTSFTRLFESELETKTKEISEDLLENTSSDFFIRTDFQENISGRLINYCLKK